MVVLLVALALAPGDARAHQPRIVGNDTQVRVSTPEVSRAFYAKLPGRPARYEITQRRPFNLYAQITVPDVDNAERDFVLRILRGRRQLARLTTAPERWKQFYEPFGGDHYLTGPTFDRNVSGGDYTVEVSSPDNRGTYVLAIGKKEQWSPGEAANALAVLPQIKHDYFGQSEARAWFSRTIPVLLIAIVLIALAVLGVLRIVRHRRRAGDRDLC